MDIREYTSPTLPVAQFVERYVDTDHYDAGCRGCDNYGQVWVCPMTEYICPARLFIVRLMLQFASILPM